MPINVLLSFVFCYQVVAVEVEEETTPEVTSARSADVITDKQVTILLACILVQKSQS